MLHSESIAAISAALAKAQGAIATAAKDSKNPHFNSKYADLASIWDACREPLSANNIAVVQAPGATADKVIEMTTILAHSSGEWFRETLTIPMSKVDAQGYGSAVTYARRYALAAMVGIAPAEDDGNAASAIGGDNNAPRRPAAAPAPAPVVPANGWEEWGKDVCTEVDGATDIETVESIKQRELKLMKAAAKAAPKTYAEIGDAFTRARADFATAPEEKKAA